VDVNNEGDSSFHQQEATGGQLVTIRLVPSRLQCGIGLLPLLPPFFTYGEGVLLVQQLRALCLDTELETKKKRKGAFVLACFRRSAAAEQRHES